MTNPAFRIKTKGYPKILNMDGYGKLPIKGWLDDIEDKAFEQAIDLSNLPFAYHHIALMPDCHVGFGMPIGGVMATQGVVVSNAVGSDIGCGMALMQTSLEELDIDTLKEIMGEIRKVIPVGFDHHKANVEWLGSDEIPDIPIINQEIKSAEKQLGTLGSGNHFIEIQKGSDGFIWIMLHSGSRNFGYKIAKVYHEKAKALCERWFSNIPNKDLSFLPIGTKEAKEYITAMNYALDFAKSNRLWMIIRIKEIINKIYHMAEFEKIIDVHHNYARWENHFNKNVLVHRKGATSARLGEVAIIPGSQGTKSYLCKGLGNKESFESCSHGAGRCLGRKAAKDKLDLKEEQDKMRGILHSVRNKDDLDEAPGAYKNIQDIMEQQKDLIEIEVEFTPLGVIKG